MAEASAAAYGAAIGVAIAMAVVCIALRGRGHPEGPEYKITTITYEIFLM